MMLDILPETPGPLISDVRQNGAGPETLRLAELLDARHRVVPLLGRDQEQRSLREWLTVTCDRPDRTVQHGRGATCAVGQPGDTPLLRGV